ncbi:MAG: PA2779 family protein [Burkholderiaceae bacterium]
MKRLRRGIASLLVASVAFTGFLHTAQATLIGTEQVAQASANRTDDRSRIEAALARDDVRERLQDFGVDPQQARERVAALTDAEAARLAGVLDDAPAAAGPGVLGAVLFVFVLLLVTDILGLTKVFPFTRSVR